MRLFNFFKSDNKRDSQKISFNLTDFKFLSDDHTRFENGRPTNANNKGAWRGIRIRTKDNITFFVTMYNMDGNHPVWGDNIQMAEKRMKLMTQTNDKIILRGFGTDMRGASFADYGITLHKSNNGVNKITLHMYDRLIDIVYEKAEDKQKSESLNQYSDFDNFKEFTRKWNTCMPMNEKRMIALQSDNVNNRGVEAYNIGDLRSAIVYFEKALKLMPNNDDALNNLKLCYSKIGNQEKVNEMIQKLNYLD